MDPRRPTVIPEVVIQALVEYIQSGMHPDLRDRAIVIHHLYHKLNHLNANLWLNQHWRDYDRAVEAAQQRLKETK